MFYIDDTNMGNYELPSDIREIALITSKNPKYIGKSIFLKTDIDPNKSILGKITISDIEETKNKCGRDGRKLRKIDVKEIYDKINKNISYIPYGDKGHDIIDKVHKKVIEDYNKLSPGGGILEFKLGELDYGPEGEPDHDGYITPIPIINSSFTKKKLKHILMGKTNYIIRQSHNGPLAGWEGKEIYGNMVETLLEDGKEKVKNRELIVDPVLQNIEESDIKLIESKYLNDEKLGYIRYSPTGDELIEISYVYGPNRSGKTYYSANYAKLWSEIFIDWPIYLFSRREKDKVLDDIQSLRRVEIDERLVTEPLSMTDFENSLVIFDDIDTIVDKKICLAIQKLRDDIMETGRQKMIYVINTSHLAMNWKPTRTVLNEANSYTLFPRKGNYEHNFKILRDKMGLKTKVIRDIIEKPDGLAYKGRWGWVTVYRDSPQYLIYENGVRLL